MSSSYPSPGFFKTVLVLLRASQKRAAGRRRRQNQLLRHRASGNAIDWGCFGLFLFSIGIAVLHIVAAVSLNMAVKSAQYADAESRGKIVVSARFMSALAANEKRDDDPPSLEKAISAPSYRLEAVRISKRTGESEETVERKIRQQISLQGYRGFISRDEASPGLRRIGTAPLPAMIGSLVLFLWISALVFQGEGLELDIQRRRHPMWEWLFSHPVPPGAIFLAEMLSPLAANPVFWGAPLFVGFVFGFAYNSHTGFIALFFVGVPLTVALACLGKALEIGVILRFSPRSRGAMIGLMSWIGYCAMVLIFLTFFLPKILPVISKLPNLFLTLPWPWLRLFLGAGPDGALSFSSGLFNCLTGIFLTILGAIGFSTWAARKGLGGNSSSNSKPIRSKNSHSLFGKEPLYRKELLWFIRDRGAIVQAVLIPFTIAAAQAFNLRFLLKHAHDSWNFLCGIAIIIGTYFLWVLGPRSLSSEGPAMWISLTWPRGLEGLLKAKAWLWSMISSIIVGLIMLYAVYITAVRLTVQ